jgi:hypothetical protein
MARKFPTLIDGKEKLSMAEVATAPEQRNRRKRGPRKPKENIETQQTATAEDLKSQQKTQTNKTKTPENRPERRVRAPYVVTPDEDGVAEVRVAASRSREMFAIPIRQAFASGQTTKIILKALGGSIPNAIYAADELFRAGVCQPITMVADTILGDDDVDVNAEANAEQPEEKKTGGRRTARIFITVLPSPTWDHQSDTRLHSKSTTA